MTSGKAVSTVAMMFLLAAGPLAAQRKTKAKPKSKAPVVNVQAFKDQIARLTEERDAFKAKAAQVDDCPQALAAAQKSRELARQEAEACRRELDQIRTSVNDNQRSGDAILKEAQKARQELAACQAEVARMKAKVQEAEVRLQGESIREGALVPLTPDVTPARPINLNRVTPRVRKVDPGVVVVNVLISEKGDVLDSRLLQGLPGESEWITKAHEACLDAAKRLVFDPARAADGKTRLRVWQGVGFHLE